MRRLFNYLIALAAVSAFASCSPKEILPSTEGQLVSLRIHASEVETKTGLESVDVEGTTAYAPYWNTDDKISVIFDSFAGKTTFDATLANTSADKSAAADFSAEDITLKNGTTLLSEGTVYSFYPADAYATSSLKADDKTVRVNVPSTQTPAAVDTFDPLADILVGQPSDYMYDGGFLIADVNFARALSIVEVKLLSGAGCPANVAVKSLSITAPDATVLTGRVTLSLAALNGTDSPLGSWTVSNNVVKAQYVEDFHPVIGGEKNTVYLLVNPTKIASGSKITFDIDSEDYTISKEVTLPSDLSFPQGRSATINLTIAGSNCTPKVAESRIFVDDFSKVTANKSQPAPSATGATGTGLTQNTTYEYTGNNTNIRFNSNGHSSEDPYLYLAAVDAPFTICNIAVSEQEDLSIAAQVKNAGTVTVEYKESKDDTWSSVASWTSTSAFSSKLAVFTISNTATSIDLRFSGSAIIVDDLVLDTFVDNRSKLATPAGLSAAVDSQTPNKINITWNAVEHASAYRVEVSADGEQTVVLTPATASVSVEKLAYSKTYSVIVKATTTDVENYIDSEFCSAVTVTTGAKPTNVASWNAVSFADLADGDQVVIVGFVGENSYAMSNDNGTSSAPTAVGVGASDKSLDDAPSANIIWTVGKNTNGIEFYESESKWLYCTSTNNGVRVGTNTDKTFVLDNGYLKHVKTSRYLGVYNQADWRCYTTSTVTNIANQTFKFYVNSNPVKKYSVSCATVDGGTLSADPASAEAGTTITLTATPKNSYFEFNNDWKVVAADNSEVTVTDNTFVMPEQNVTVTGTFTDNTPTDLPGTANRPYTIDEVYTFIDGLNGATSSSEVYVAGTIYQVDSYNSSYGSITYWIGSAAKPFEVYGGLGLNGEKFSAQTDLHVGDQVVVKGYVKKYNSTYEFDKNSVLISIQQAPYLTAEASKTAKISADGETIDVTVDTNVESWTATSNNTAFVISDKTATSFKIVVAKNESTTDERTAKITVSADGVTPVEISLTQNKKSTSSEPQTVTITMGSSKDMSSNEGQTKDDITITAIDGTSNPNNYQSTHVRLQAGGSFVITPDNATITKIVLTCNSGYEKTWSASTGSAPVVNTTAHTVTWTGESSSEVILTNTASSQSRVSSVSVTYIPNN